MARALQAMIFGARAVGRAPVIILTTYLLLIAAVVPAAGAMMWTLTTALDERVLDREEGPMVDEAWFARANEASRPVVGDSFSPTIVGFAAPLSNLADLIGARYRSLPASLTLVAWLLAWTFLLGGVLQRFAQDAPIGVGAFLKACVRRLLPFSAIALGSLAIYAVAVALYGALPSQLQVLLLVLMVAVGSASLAASYTRARIVIEGVRLWPALTATARMMRSSPLTCAAHATLALCGWVMLLIALAGTDLLLGRGGQPWRAIVLVQAFIVGRIVLRLAWEASTLNLVRALK